MSTWLHTLGWVLIHFVWQGAALVIAASIILRLSARQAPSVRYAIACGTLMMMLMATVATAAMANATVIDLSAAGRSAVPSQVSTVASGEARPLSLEAFLSFAGSMRQGHAVEAVFPWIVSAWMLGVALLLARTSAGWWRVRRLHRVAMACAPSRWQTAANRLAARLQLSRAVRIVELANVDVPFVVGCLRPIVVLPIAAFSHLSPAQADAILAHELAHIRRHDYVINLVQTLAETLLFYHPGVWWISARIRDEREHCCDDVAVEVCGDPVGYAAALADLEERRFASPSLVPAATGGSLLNRVRRILHAEIPHQGDAPHWIVICAFAALLVTAGVWRLEAQGPDLGERRTFEVASIKPNTSGETRLSNMIQPGGRYNAINVPLRNFIINAYRLQESQLAGAPEWISSERFDIVAKAEGEAEPPLPVVQSMIRSLLEERFKLRVHWESRELPIYALILARPDGKLGPDLKPSTTDCTALEAARRGSPPPSGPPPPSSPGSRPTCGARIGFGEAAAGSRPLLELVSLLAQTLRRPVFDRTGLKGNFDFYMKWTPDNLPPRAPGTPADQPLRVNGLVIDPNGPSIFTALQEQLGLKLDSTRGPVDVLVIDHVERPSPD